MGTPFPQPSSPSPEIEPGVREPARMQAPRTLRALFSLAGFVASARLKGVFGDRFARVVVLRRRKKRRGDRHSQRAYVSHCRQRPGADAADLVRRAGASRRGLRPVLCRAGRQEDRPSPARGDGYVAAVPQFAQAKRATRAHRLRQVPHSAPPERRARRGPAQRVPTPRRPGPHVHQGPAIYAALPVGEPLPRRPPQSEEAPRTDG